MEFDGAPRHGGPMSATRPNEDHPLLGTQGASSPLGLGSPQHSDGRSGELRSEGDLSRKLSSTLTPGNTGRGGNTYSWLPAANGHGRSHSAANLLSSSPTVRPALNSTSSASSVKGSPSDGGAALSKVQSGSSKWAPFWLRRPALVPFIIVHAAVVGAISYLAVYSSSHLGLLETIETLQYLWRFAPVAVFVLTAAVWSRTELQALLFTPWVLLLRCDHHNNIGSGAGVDDCASCREVLELDYVNAFSPAALVRALWKRHFLAALVLLADFILKAQIVLAASLLTVEKADMEVDVPVTVLDSFREFTFPTSPEDGPFTRDDAVRVADLRVYYEAIARRDLDTPHPFGLDQGVAYQRFEVAKDSEVGRRFGDDSDDIEIEVEVDALRVDLYCEQSPFCEEGHEPRLDGGGGPSVLTFPSCTGGNGTYRPNLRKLSEEYDRDDDVLVQWYDEWDPNVRFEDSGNTTPPTAWPEDREVCSTFPHDTRFFFHFVGILKPQGPFAPANDNQGDMEVHECAAVLCSPVVSAGPQKMSRRGSVTTLINPPPKISFPDTTTATTVEGEEGDGKTRRLKIDLEPVLVLSTSSASDPLFRMTMSTGVIERGSGVRDSPSALVNTWLNAFPTPEGINFLNESLSNSGMESMLRNLYQNAGPISAHFSFREDAQNPTTVMGRGFFKTDRLVVNRPVAFAIVGLSSTSIVLVLALVFLSAREFLPRSPFTHLGLATFLRKGGSSGGLVGAESSGEELDLLLPVTSTSRFRHDKQASGIRRLSLTRGSNNAYSPIQHCEPWITSPWFRGLMVLLVTLLIVALLVLLRQSETEDGIYTVEPSQSQFQSLLWTALPAALVLICSLHTTSCNGLLRGLAPLVEISSTPSRSPALDVSWLDMFGAQVLWQALRRRRWWIASHETLTIIATFLTLLSATLFNVVEVDSKAQTSMALASWFEGGTEPRPDDKWADRASLVSLLVVDRNTSSFRYPNNTYYDLVFPNLEWRENDTIAVTFANGTSSSSSSSPVSFNPDARITTTIPALRLDASCGPVPNDTYKLLRMKAGPFGLDTSVIDTSAGKSLSEILDGITPDSFPPDEFDDLFGNIGQGGIDFPTASGYTIVQGRTCPDGTVAITATEHKTRGSNTNRTADGGGTYFAHVFNVEDPFYSLCGDEYPPKDVTVLDINGELPLSWTRVRNRRWLWGHSRDGSPEQVDESLSYWSCDFAWVQLDANVTLLPDTLALDYSRPPVVDESSARPPEGKAEILVPDIWSEGSPVVSGTDNHHVMFPRLSTPPEDSVIFEFRPLLAPLGPFSREDLLVKDQGEEKTRKEASIIEMVVENSRIMAAQALSLENRRKITGTTTGTAKAVLARQDITSAQVNQSAPAVSGPGQTTRDATFAVPGRRRLVQDPGPTYATVAILLLILAVNIWGLAVSARRGFDNRRGRPRHLVGGTGPFVGFVPDRAASILTQARLWVHSDVFASIQAAAAAAGHDGDHPHNGGVAAWLSVEGLHAALRSKVFEFGPFLRSDDGRQIFTIHMTDDNYGR